MKSLEKIKQDALEILNMYEYRHLSLNTELSRYFKMYVSIAPDTQTMERFLNDFGIVDSHLVKQIIG